MKKIPTKIDGAWLVQPRLFPDARGFFLESWNKQRMAEIGLDVDFVQDNHSRSQKGVLRGLHYQSGAAAQGKYVWVTSGRVFDVLVDLRESSPTFGQWDGYVLDAERHERLWIPPGCAHGFLVLSDEADFHYKCTKPYRPDAERCLAWNDPAVGIRWPLEEIGGEPLLSEKDSKAPGLDGCEKYL